MPPRLPLRLDHSSRRRTLGRRIARARHETRRILWRLSLAGRRLALQAADGLPGQR